MVDGARVLRGELKCYRPDVVGRNHRFFARLLQMITGGSINDQGVSSVRTGYKANIVRKRKKKPESCFDCSDHPAQDEAGAELLKFMLVPMPRTRPTPRDILGRMDDLGLRDVGPSSDTPTQEQLSQARSEIEALKREQARSGSETFTHNLAEPRTREVDGTPHGDGEGLIFEPVRAHRELAELRNSQPRAFYTPTRSDGSPGPFRPPSEREGVLSTRLGEASQYETEAAWRETRVALQRETEAAWRETQAALREKEVKETEARIEREAVRKEFAAVQTERAKEVAAVRMERDKEVAAVRMERDKEIATVRAERDAALNRHLDEVSILRAERDAALKEAALKETALAVAQAVMKTESRMAAELTQQDQHLAAQWHLGLPNAASSAKAGSPNVRRTLFDDASTDADLREGVSGPLFGPPRGGSDAVRSGVGRTPTPVAQLPRQARPASANADSRLRGSPYQQPLRPQPSTTARERSQTQNRRHG